MDVWSQEVSSDDKPKLLFDSKLHHFRCLLFKFKLNKNCLLFKFRWQLLKKYLTNLLDKIIIKQFNFKITNFV